MFKKKIGHYSLLKTEITSAPKFNWKYSCPSFKIKYFDKTTSGVMSKFYQNKAEKLSFIICLHVETQFLFFSFQSIIARKLYM